uniref:orotidine-5'-phosphate decarboxylase n=1 Tax=Pararhizobium sp. IMCC3301 TaxID=3067904 RepID=UPI0027429A59|nr:orotidine-5'-phosphate decarboxylase [Pararhizobium sp. IMCC3301]
MRPEHLTARDRVIVALDYSGTDEARALVETLGDSASFYKIGYQLAFAGGLALVAELKAAGKRVFLDLKLLDIDNSIKGGVSSIAALGADMLTLHAYPKAMAAAVAAKKETPAAADLSLLGVTVLTSMDDDDLQDAGYHASASDLVASRGAQALSAGMDALVCSSLEASALRAIVGDNMALVVPGIRPKGSDHGDQKRVMTPAQAVNAGADYLVIGRPINAAENPVAVMQAIVAELEGSS